MHDLFFDTAEHLARDSGFCQRARKLTGPLFAQTLVFTLLHKPDATLDDFADFALQHLHLDVSPQAFDQRFTQPAADFLYALWQEAFQRCFASAVPNRLPVLRHFNGVYLRDGSLIRLPDSLADLFPGRSGPGGQPHAAVKLVLEVEVTTGQFTDASLVVGTANEKTAPVASQPLPAGALLLEDMGFLSGERLQDYVDQGVYVLTRIPCWTALFVQGPGTRQLRRLNLLKHLRREKGSVWTGQVYVFAKQQVPLRLLVMRVPEAEAEQRRQRVRQEARRRGRAVSQKKLDLCDWTILVTNAPATLLSVHDAWDVRRVRWQIELIFKLFKSEGGLERTRSQDRGRVQCELFAKLLAVMVQNWVLLAAGYVMLKHSARRAARRVRGQAGALLEALREASAFAERIAVVAVMVQRRCRVKPRSEHQSTYDRLKVWDYPFRQLEAVA